MRILRSCYVNLSKKCFLLGWFICQPLFYCDQVSVGFDESLISRTAAFGAHKIGDLHKPTDGSPPISGAVHKSLHTANGAILGALTAAATGQDVGKVAASGGFGGVALDLPASHQFMKMESDDFTQRMLLAINRMMLDMLAAVARKDYEDRRRRQTEGIDKAKKIGKYKGRKINRGLHENIEALLKAGKSYSTIVNLLGCSRSTISKISQSNPRP